MARKFEDLSGRQVNDLEVLYRLPNRISSNGKAIVMYRCRCKCGKETDVKATALKSNTAKSCGCGRSKAMANKNLKDLTDTYVGRWHVLYRAEDAIEPSGKHVVVWHCKCECGTERDVRASTLKNGQSLSCGCYKHDVLSSGRNLEDAVFGRWTVLYKGRPKWSEKSQRFWPTWHCRCECGTERDVTEISLVSNRSVSCGCYRKERCAESATYEDLTGRHFNSWEVLNREPDRFYPGGGRATMWKCRCECGQIRIVAGNMLKSGISQSCGCLNAPVLEMHVRTYLERHAISYETQKTFDGLNGVGGNPLSYDFYLPLLGILIECQGEQHYRPVEYFGGNEKFEIQQEHDARKQKYAQDNGMRLIEINYKTRSYDAIDTELSRLI